MEEKKEKNKGCLIMRWTQHKISKVDDLLLFRGVKYLQLTERKSEIIQNEESNAQKDTNKN